MGKILLSGFCLVLLAVNCIGDGNWINTKSGTHNLILCTSYDGILAHSEHVSVEAALFKVRTYTVTYPTGILSDKTITCIKVIDRVYNGDGGWVSIIRGGTGYKDVQILLTSQKSRKMVFDIEIYVEP